MTANIIHYSAGKVKSFFADDLARDIMLNDVSGTSRAGDLVLTRCPNPIRIHLRGADAPSSPKTSAYSPRMAWVGCRNCEVCEREVAASRVTEWQRRLKALLAFEVEQRGVCDGTCPQCLKGPRCGYGVYMVTLTFPPHPDGDEERDGAPDEDMVQGSWHHFLANLREWYESRGIDWKEAINHVSFLEAGMRRRRLHMHMLIVYRDGFSHPHIETPKTASEVNGLGRIWFAVLKSRGFGAASNDAFYHAPVKSVAQAAAYCCGAYLTKGFMEDDTYRVRPMRQSPSFKALKDWHRDKRYDLAGQEYRRWIGFRLDFNELTIDTMKERCKSLARYYCDWWVRGVSVQIPHTEKVMKVQRHHVDEGQVGLSLVKELSEHMAAVSKRNRELYGHDEENWTLPVFLTLKPVLVALSDTPVSRPSAADFLSVREVFDTGEGYRYSQDVLVPSEHFDERFNLCGASHWFPLDTQVLSVRDTEVFEELLGWSRSLWDKFHKTVIRALDESLPGNAFKTISEGLPMPVELVGDDVIRFASEFPDVLPDTSLLPTRLAPRKLNTRPSTLPAVSRAVRAGMKAAEGWQETTDIRLPKPWRQYPLRQGQVAIIDRVQLEDAPLAERSGIYCLPTGFGKSVCYQFPSVRQGITLVVSPLLSLMRDQVRSLTERGIKATWIGGEHPKNVKVARLEEIGAVNRQDTDGEPCIVYCAPEAFVGTYTHPRTREVHRKFLAGFLEDGYLNVSHLVVDEAHCVSEWADFREHYTRIAEAAQTWMYQERVLSLFSATISPRILADIRHYFGPLDFFALPVERPNLFLRRSPHDFYGWYARHRHELSTPALVFCGTRNRTEMLAAFLQSEGHNAEFYHANLDAVYPKTHPNCGEPKYPNHDRVELENRFFAGDLDILCCTIAFGMGIDKPDVRTVVHESLPASIEAYSQELGRAGRDGEPSTCWLLDDPGMRENREMEALLRSDTCLWQYIAAHHGQDAEVCGHCDVCQS